MSVNSVNSADPTKHFKKCVIGSTAAGAAIGGAYAATKQNYMSKGAPTDLFVNAVSLNLSMKMKPKQLKESRLINQLAKKAVDPTVDVKELIPLIHQSEELSEAVKATPEETVFDGLKRIFSQPEDKIRTDLVELQLKTKSNKKNSLHTAKDFIVKNYDPMSKQFVQHNDTTEGIFRMIKKTAYYLQSKYIEAGMLIGGIVAGSLALIACEYPDKKK